MPEMGTQVYWHECPDPNPPWVNQEELRRTVQRSRQFHKSMHIVPFDAFAGNSSRERKELRTRKNVHEKADRGLLMEPGLTTFGAINLLFHHLGKAPLTRAEAMDAVQIISEEYRAVEEQTQATFAESQAAASQQLGSSQAHPSDGAAATAQDVKEGPLLQTVRLFLERRGLRMEVLSKRELQAKHCRISAADLIPGRRVAALFDKQRSAMACAIVDGKVSPHAVRNSMHVLVPVPEPCPWRRRVYTLAGIDAFRCIATFIYHAELDMEDAEIAVEASGETDVVSSSMRGGGDASSSESSRGSVNSSRVRCRDRRVVIPEPVVLPRRTGRMLQLQPSLLPPRHPKGGIEHSSSAPSNLGDAPGGKYNHHSPDAEQQRGRKRARVDVVHPADVEENVQMTWRSVHRKGKHSSSSRSSSSGASDSSSQIIGGDDEIVISNYKPLRTKRATAEELAAMPYPIRENKMLNASSLRKLDPFAKEERPVARKMMCIANINQVAEERSSDKQRQREKDQREAGQRRRIVTWLDPANNGGTAIAPHRVAQRCEQMHNEVEASLHDFGYHCERLEPSGVVKLQFPMNAARGSEDVLLPLDPFVEVPTVTIASKYRERKHVKHSWTQRLVESERRFKLYS